MNPGDNITTHDGKRMVAVETGRRTCDGCDIRHRPTDCWDHPCYTEEGKPLKFKEVKNEGKS